MRPSTHYNTPIIPQIAEVTLTAEGQQKTWVSSQVRMGAMRFDSDVVPARVEQASKSPVEVYTVYTLAFRDEFPMPKSLSYYRFRVGTKILYPRTFCRYNGAEYVVTCSEEEDESNG